MIEDVVVEPMTNEFVLWRCLHGGPLTRHTIDQWSSADKTEWERYRQRNLPLLIKITRTYGACAIIARDNDAIIGQLRFYPKVICELKDAGGLCLQQDHPAGPTENFVDSDFPDPAQIEDKTLVVHCVMTGSPHQKENPYQRKGIGTRMVRALIHWAKANGWERIEADSFEDIPIIYEMTGSTGHTFWEKLGFRVVDRHPHPELQDRSQFDEFVTTLEEQAKSIGILPERARDRLVMRLDVT
ncbi:GNAT family N-acetyltransferase [Candidatus Hydrogenedentota bacterium]